MRDNNIYLDDSNRGKTRTGQVICVTNCNRVEIEEEVLSQGTEQHNYVVIVDIKKSGLDEWVHTCKNAQKLCRSIEEKGDKFVRIIAPRDKAILWRKALEWAQKGGETTLEVCEGPKKDQIKAGKTTEEWKTVKPRKERAKQTTIEINQQRQKAARTPQC
jgi:hypothetical protein